MSDKIAFAACPNLISELRSVIKSHYADEAAPILMRTDCFKKCVVDRPFFERSFVSGCQKYGRIEILSGCFCDKDGLISSSSKIRVYPEPLCFKLFINPGIVDSLIKSGCYLLTPVWLSRWKYIVEKVWGFNNSGARNFFKESGIKKIVLIDTGVFNGSTKIDINGKLTGFSEYMRLPCENIRAGLHYFKAIIDARINSWRIELADRNHKRQIADYNKKLSHNMAAFEFTDEISSTLDEKTIAEKTAGLFLTLFAPVKISYYSLRDLSAQWTLNYKNAAGSGPQKLEYTAASVEDDNYLKGFISKGKAFHKPYCIEHETGFSAFLGAESEIYGFVSVCGVQFPEYMDDYVELAAAIVNIASIALSNARKYQKITAAIEEVKRATKAKDLFFANMSHELRTPIASIIGFCDLLNDEKIKGAVREFLSYIKTSADLLMSHVNNILDFSKMESGRMAIDNSEFSLSCLIKEVAGVIKAQAGAKSIKLEIEIDSADERLIGDYAKLRQVLLNLTANAVKFSEKNSRVYLKASLVVKTNETCCIKFSVKDEGIGIAEDKLQSIFRPFSQADGSVARRFGGTGLGLSISDGLVKIMGGTGIEVESVPREGSCFYFTLKFKKAGHEKIGPASSETAVSLKIGQGGPRYEILVIDDNAMNLSLMEKMVKKLGYGFIKADSGASAVEIVKKRASAGEEIHLIFVDIQMPDMDGIQTSLKIRETGCMAPIVAVSASNLDAYDPAAVKKAGIDFFMHRPIGLKNIMEAVGRFIERG